MRDKIATWLNYLRSAYYVILGTVGVPRTARQIDRILERIPFVRSRYRWCSSGACACMGCVNHSEWGHVRQFRLRPSEHARWVKWKVAKIFPQREEIPIVVPPKQDVLRKWGPQ